ncbi:hypothetical protein QBC46DRAFT_373869 [Diplogelasinospora grovesii]|uniref:Uncharacterized protein n=1 Tax=Diplogelasinospora grovesii TaxID=303347 RepID=A0AAN6NJ37_9PEZI|nr:hypothetical protein QBC46DRAFT_373869 [Diplogelasinospora grovesii]
MAALDLLTTTNLSYHSIPAAFVLAMIPHTYANMAAGKNYDLANPRKTAEHLQKDTTLNKVTLRRIQRAQAAAANGLETIALYAAAVVAANTSGRITIPTLNKLALGYLAARALYNFTYVILQDNARIAPLRTLFWAASIGVIFALFTMAA